MFADVKYVPQRLAYTVVLFKQPYSIDGNPMLLFSCLICLADWFELLDELESPLVFVVQVLRRHLTILCGGRCCCRRGFVLLKIERVQVGAAR